MNVIIECESGIEALVSAPSVALAQDEWDAAVASGGAEPGVARAPRRGEVRELARCYPEHDYR